MTNLSELAGVANNDGGFTYNPMGDFFPSSGFAVGIFKNKEKRIASPILSTEHLAEFVEFVEDQLRVPGCCIGGWLVAGIWYLDVSVLMPTFESAIELAKEHDQIAIYNLSTHETIYLKNL